MKRSFNFFFLFFVFSFKYMRIKYRYSLLLFLILIVSCRSGSKSSYSYHQHFGEIFATGYNIKYAYNLSLEEEIVAELHKFDLSLNPFKENSIISKVNRNEPVELDSFFLKVFRKSEEVSRKSQGKFDITVSPLINAWGFGFQKSLSVMKKYRSILKII